MVHTVLGHSHVDSVAQAVPYHIVLVPARARALPETSDDCPESGSENRDTFVPIFNLAEKFCSNL